MARLPSVMHFSPSRTEIAKALDLGQTHRGWKPLRRLSTSSHSVVIVSRIRREVGR